MHASNNECARTRGPEAVDQEHFKRIGLLKAAVIRGIDLFGRHAHVDGDTRPFATNLMFHEFFGANETRSRGRERLKRLCGWLRSQHAPISAREYLEDATRGRFKKNAVFVTFDDARAKLLDGIDIFSDHEIPVTVFAACGWIAGPRPRRRGQILARLMATIEHYKGDPKTVLLPDGQRLCFGSADPDAEVARLVAAVEQRPDLEAELWDDLDASIKNAVIGPVTCDWSELSDLAALGVSVQSHSMSHCRLRRKSLGRIEFEVSESRRMLEKEFGDCQMFAYPYGTWDVYSDATTSAIKLAGYRSAFLAAAGFGLSGDNTFLLPRIDIPDGIGEKLSISLMRGGQIPLILLKNTLTGRNRVQKGIPSP
jgi:peptidoglycan/xylan/chitin deacetylase (PgdA/CDA1 family)